AGDRGQPRRRAAHQQGPQGEQPLLADVGREVGQHDRAGQGQGAAAAAGDGAALVPAGGQEEKGGEVSDSSRTPPPGPLSATGRGPGGGVAAEVARCGGPGWSWGSWCSACSRWYSSGGRCGRSAGKCSWSGPASCSSCSASAWRRVS